MAAERSRLIGHGFAYLDGRHAYPDGRLACLDGRLVRHDRVRRPGRRGATGCPCAAGNEYVAAGAAFAVILTLPETKGSELR